MNEKLNFCTLFDSNYLTRALAMHASLARVCPNFHLFIFAFDELSFNVLKSLSLSGVTIIPLSEFEDDSLLKIKPSRSPVEYCWTCTPSTVLYCLEKYSLSSCTYLDADIFFYSNPDVLIQEMNERNVLITEHRFSEKYKESVVNGIYNVQFVTFRNNPAGKAVLQWWRSACIEWCYARLEDGKLGDQKYLDDWTTRFEGVHVLNHLGGGMGPWNIQQYEVSREDSRESCLELKSGKRFSAIFYHFHNFKIYPGGYSRALGYDLSHGGVEFIYKPYLKELIYQYNRVKDFPGMTNKGFVTTEISSRELFREFLNSDFKGNNLILFSAARFASHLLKKFFYDSFESGLRKIKFSS